MITWIVLLNTHRADDYANTESAQYQKASGLFL